MMTWERGPGRHPRGAFRDHFGTPSHIGMTSTPAIVLVLGTDQCAMFLDRDQVAELLPDLVTFVRTGKLRGPPEPPAVKAPSGEPE